MDLPSISIVTPSYNQAQYLDETIQSVLDQGYPNLQYMVIDGGSTDGSVEVIKKYEKHLDYWVSEKDKGQMDALNKGVRRSTGEIFGFINSDDLLYPRALQRVADTWNLGARWIVGWCKYLELEGSDYPYLPRAHGRKVDYFLDNPFPQQSSFWAKICTTVSTTNSGCGCVSSRPPNRGWCASAWGHFDTTKHPKPSMTGLSPRGRLQ
jgi:glycosyltransferase involved in cell wall biosynthesis